MLAIPFGCLVAVGAAVLPSSIPLIFVLVQAVAVAAMSY
jgi:hypothetical protein